MFIFAVVIVSAILYLTYLGYSFYISKQLNNYMF